MYDSKREILAWILVGVLFVTTVCLGYKTILYKQALTQINQDVEYVINNISFRVAPRDIKQKLETIKTLSTIRTLKVKKEEPKPKEEETVKK